MKKRLAVFLSVLLTIVLFVSSVQAVSLPEPVAFNTNVSAPPFTMTEIGGGILTSENYGAGKNLMLVYGRITCYNTNAFLAGIQDAMGQLSENGVTVLVGLHDNPSDEDMTKFANYYKGIICGKVSNYYSESGLWTGLEAVGAKTGSVTFPAVFLRSADGRLRYYSTGYVNDPMPIVSAAIVMSKGSLPTEKEETDPPKQDDPPQETRTEEEPPQGTKTEEQTPQETKTEEETPQGTKTEEESKPETETETGTETKEEKAPETEPQEEKEPETEPEKEATIDLGTKKMTIKDGKAQTITATLGNPQDSIIKVKSSNSKVAKGSFSGNEIRITPNKKAGKTTITVKTAKGAEAKLTVTVKEYWELNEKSITLKKGEKFKIQVSTFPSSIKAKSFESSKSKVAKVDKKGKITAKKKGKATITVTLSNGKTLKLKVKVE